MNFMYILFTLIFPSVKLRENSLSKSPHYITPSQFTKKKKISQKKKFRHDKKKDLVRKSLNWLIMRIARSVHDFNDDCWSSSKSNFHVQFYVYVHFMVSIFSSRCSFSSQMIRYSCQVKGVQVHVCLEVFTFSSGTRPCRRRVRRPDDSVPWCCSLTCTCRAGCPTPPQSFRPLTRHDLCHRDHVLRDLSGTGYLPCYHDLLFHLCWKTL